MLFSEKNKKIKIKKLRVSAKIRAHAEKFWTKTHKKLPQFRRALIIIFVVGADFRIEIATITKTHF